MLGFFTRLSPSFLSPMSLSWWWEKRVWHYSVVVKEVRKRQTLSYSLTHKHILGQETTDEKQLFWVGRGGLSVLSSVCFWFSVGRKRVPCLVSEETCKLGRTVASSLFVCYTTWFTKYLSSVHGLELSSITTRTIGQTPLIAFNSPLRNQTQILVTAFFPVQATINLILVNSRAETGKSKSKPPSPISRTLMIWGGRGEGKGDDEGVREGEKVLGQGVVGL